MLISLLYVHAAYHTACKCCNGGADKAGSTVCVKPKSDLILNYKKDDILCLKRNKRTCQQVLISCGWKNLPTYTKLPHGNIKVKKLDLFQHELASSWLSSANSSF
jgi:hypothetical protein